ncbi:hypothetical protein CLI64_16665 [Nostoc sp. CENA543]|uniref:hypothetical protein n=1 Tax=Nostoc sp. CENA543 TaxID=1869241 RepID=UPI000CA1CB80|nr:hypothetical protein [Nostoc sp. CENA543]AUT01887.1 hypothetical protein CLI64_16665 [Nostoc sp. CENA543]
MSEQKDVIGEILNSLRVGDANEETAEKQYDEEYVNLLKSACKNFIEKEDFVVGQIVKWKDNLKNRKFPYYNQPAIVISILDEPVISQENESGSPYFLETLDIILGIIVDDGTFLTFYYDSRRFESY